MQRNLQFFSVFLLFSLYFCSTVPLDRYIAKFHPKTIKEGDHVARQYPKFKMEVTMSFGMTEQMILFVESVVEEHFKSRFEVEALSEIQQTVQGYLGGYWGVQFYEDPYMFFTTSTRRSPCFVVLDVNGSGIAIIKGS
ncbi:unnamed protein product [Caenorhabditis sp. 36 PRJEB53466]|nr:unnamed protein product [Caenorhabditis sp. 36 PRJEB53466]